MLNSLVQRSTRATGQFRVGGCPAARTYEDLFELRLSVSGKGGSAVVASQNSQHIFACRCVEIGSGSGYVSCSLALLLQHYNISASYIATDISLHAVTATKATLAAHQARQNCRQVYWRQSTSLSSEFLSQVIFAAVVYANNTWQRVVLLQCLFTHCAFCR